MFSFLNKFMLRSLVIKSFFILVLPLSTGFAMKEKNEDIYSIEYIDKNEIRNSNIIRNVKKEQNDSLLNKSLKEKTENLEDTPDGEGKDKQEVKKEGVVSTLEIPFHHLAATVGFFEGNDKYSKHVELNCLEDLIFFYRRPMFLFFCPLIFNSLLNFIFEIDNKPSGRYFNFFSVGWRTLPFLKIITFDIHFNWFLFAVSAWFDFVYFTNPITREDFFSEGNNKKFFIPMFFFAFVFDAVSLCVNFKIDDYFYITVNLSYFLQCIVSSRRFSIVGGDVVSTASPSVCGICYTCRGRNLKCSGGDQKVGQKLKILGKGNHTKDGVNISNFFLNKVTLINQSGAYSNNNYREAENIGDINDKLNDINTNTNNLEENNIDSYVSLLAEENENIEEKKEEKPEEED